MLLFNLNYEAKKCLLHQGRFILHIWLGLDLNSIGCYEEGLLEKKVIDLVGEISSYEISSAEISLLDKTKTLKDILLKTMNEIVVVENKIKSSK